MQARLLFRGAQIGAEAGPERVRPRGVVAHCDGRTATIGLRSPQQLCEHRGPHMVVSRGDLHDGQRRVGRIDGQFQVSDGNGAAALEGDHPLVAGKVSGVVVEDCPQLGGRGDGKPRVALRVQPLLKLQRRRELVVAEAPRIYKTHAPSVGATASAEAPSVGATASAEAPS